MSITIHFDNTAFDIHDADLDHINDAIALLRARHKYTASERLTVIRDMVASQLDPDAC